ncbi:MAG: amidohydrolase, partial [Pseudomonadota bacterium]
RMSVLFRDCLLPGGERTSVLVEGASISAVGNEDSTRGGAGSGEATGAQIIDCGGKLLAPSFTEGHIHLDKTFAGLPHIPHRYGVSVPERIAAEKALRQEVPASVFERGGRLLDEIIAFGTGRVRTHVDIDPEIGLSSLADVVRLRDANADRVDMQIVAFPQSGIVSAPGTADLMDAALTEGATHVGGLDPAFIDGDRRGHLDVVFALAGKHDAGIDIHLHEGGAMGLETLQDIAARTKAVGLHGRVTVSHAFALGEPHDIGPTLAALRKAGVAILTHGPGPVPMPPVVRLAEEGVAICAGSDNIRDAWSPYGNGDMLKRAMMIGYRQGMNTDEELALLFDIVTTRTARSHGFGEVGIAEGAPADLVLIDAETVAGAVAQHPARLTVMKGGKIVAGLNPS